jgi:putative oxidoreductase
MTRIVDFVIGLMSRIPYGIIAIIGRLAIGLTFWNSGRTKVEGWNIFHVSDKTLYLFREEYRLPFLPPEIAALMAQVAEHLLSALIILGLATRFSALGLFVMTVVIEIFVYPESYVVHGTWAAILLMLVKFGPGRLSADYLIYRR